MKRASDLRIPFVWADRHSILLEKCLYIPSFYDRHKEWSILPWSDPLIFGRKAPVKIEFCSGNGQWIGEKAKLHPEILWVAVEKQFDRARKIWARRFREGLDNLFVVCGLAEPFIRHYVPEDSVDEIFVNFPDPWPKLRHAKHRLIQKSFMNDLSRIVRKGGKATFVTDDSIYRDQMRKEILESKKWESEFSNPHYITQWPEYGDSWFYDFWLSKGKEIFYQRYIHV